MACRPLHQPRWHGRGGARVGRSASCQLPVEDCVRLPSLAYTYLDGVRAKVHVVVWARPELESRAKNTTKFSRHRLR